MQYGVENGELELVVVEKLVSGLRQADVREVEASLASLAQLQQLEGSCCSATVNALFFAAPGAGWRVLPIQSAVCSKIQEEVAVRAVNRLIDAGASGMCRMPCCRCHSRRHPRSHPRLLPNDPQASLMPRP
jgi:hypothetical protein